MKTSKNGNLIDRIVAIIGNAQLGSDLYRSISSALKQPFFHIKSKKSVWDVFQRSLNAAIRDVETHPRGQLFRRLIEFGPLYPNDNESKLISTTTILNDIECEDCIEFIYSHMVNRFKGELAELLSLEPCLDLISNLIREKRMPKSLRLYWGDAVQERRKITSSRNGKVCWGGFAKGADGLLLKWPAASTKTLPFAAKITGVFEVKSMRRSPAKLLEQVEGHVKRLCGGVKLNEQEWSPGNISTCSIREGFHRFLVMPSSWKVSREWRNIKTKRGSQLIFPEPVLPQKQALLAEIARNVWHITLSWSQEALEQAAYEMTFWYMSQIGTNIYSRKKLPRGWEYMTPAEAGYNAIKEKLYYMPLRPISPRHKYLAMRLYNVYSFGYPAAVDASRMLWPGDFAHYMVTQRALQDLKKQEVPDFAIKALKSLLNKCVIGELEFLKLLRRRIGTERTRELAPLILKKTKYYPEEWYSPDKC